MNPEKLSDLMLRAFSRFFILGVVFLVFTILLPSYLLVNLLGGTFPPQVINLLSIGIKLTDQLILFMLVAISTGILLDLTKVHSFWTNMFDKNWKDYFGKNKTGKSGESLYFKLKIELVDACEIGINRENNEQSYKDRIWDLAFQIHSVFVRIKRPEEDRKIEIQRLYPDILSMSLLSVVLGILISLIFLVIKFFLFMKILEGIILILTAIIMFFVIKAFINDKPGLMTFLLIVIPLIELFLFMKFMKSLEILDFSVLQILAAAFSIVFFVGRKTVKDEFKKLQEQTKALIRDAFKATSSDEREDFYKSLKDRGLIDGHPGEWKVKE